VAILRIINRGMDRETYQAARDMLDIDRRHPLGLIMHGASEVDGTMQVAQIWDSEEYARRFDEELLGPIIETLHLSRDPQMSVFELEDLVTP